METTFHIVYTVYKNGKVKEMEWETYEWKTQSGKTLRVKFRRIIDDKGDIWMEVSDTFTVEEIK